MNSLEKIQQIERDLDLSFDDIRESCDDDKLAEVLKYLTPYEDNVHNTTLVYLFKCNYLINNDKDIMLAVRQTLKAAIK